MNLKIIVIQTFLTTFEPTQKSSSMLNPKLILCYLWTNFKSFLFVNKITKPLNKMKYALILLSLIFLRPDSWAKAVNQRTKLEEFEGRKRKKDGRYRKKNYTFKKLILGKRYCDCPKH